MLNLNTSFLTGCFTRLEAECFIRGVKLCHPDENLWIQEQKDWTPQRGNQLIYNVMRTNQYAGGK